MMYNNQESMKFTRSTLALYLKNLQGEHAKTSIQGVWCCTCQSQNAQARQWTLLGVVAVT